MKSIPFALILPTLLLMLSLPQPAATGPFINFRVHYPNGKQKPKGDPAFTAVRKGRDLKVIQATSGQIVWQTNAHPSDHGDDLFLYLAPGMKRALLMHQYGVRGQTLYWVALDKPGVFAELSDDVWRKTAAMAAGISSEGGFTDLSVQVVRWKSPDQCFLAWDLAFGETNPYFAGVISVTFSGADNIVPVLKAGPRKANMTLDESRRLIEAGYEPLIEAWKEQTGPQ